ncbi:class I SAM-dependent methyltransferase [Caenimonas terrae]|uniref:Class I SAM-dependent methyltransferase n=1 Tax=Caenimonas terrae TaxID=696074 RepID=A0ABW0NF11_9BURK
MRSAVRPAARRRAAALEQYHLRAAHYDAELAAFEPLRAEAVALLALQPGERVLDVGCGTGLSFELLERGVGGRGEVVGIEQSPDMLQLARERVAAHGWRNVTLVAAPAEEARVHGKMDAAMFHFTHDVLRAPRALDNVLGHLKPGARVVAVGLQWAPPWAWPANLFVALAALYSISAFEGLGRPWDLLARRLQHFQLHTTLLGGIYVASGVAR